MVSDSSPSVLVLRLQREQGSSWTIEGAADTQIFAAGPSVIRIFTFLNVTWEIQTLSEISQFLNVSISFKLILNYVHQTQLIWAYFDFQATSLPT